MWRPALSNLLKFLPRPFDMPFSCFGISFHWHPLYPLGRWCGSLGGLRSGVMTINHGGGESRHTVVVWYNMSIWVDLKMVVSRAQLGASISATQGENLGPFIWMMFPSWKCFYNVWCVPPRRKSNIWLYWSNPAMVMRIIFLVGGIDFNTRLISTLPMWWSSACGHIYGVVFGNLPSRFFFFLPILSAL
jgi:hypothetical protein